MPPTIISSKAGNWVDRGEPADATITRVLSRFCNQNVADRRDWFREQAAVIQGMVAADATEVHLAGFLRTLLPEDEASTRDVSQVRTTAIALWHIAKAALVRDFAERVLRGEIPANAPTPDSLSHWLAARLLSPEELARFEAHADEPEED